ncbi:MAG: NAD(P)H-dependent oxidoreductase subunit E [Candidatus Thiodiazotropha sp.]
MNNENEPLISRLINTHGQRADALMPLLHDVQDALGYIPPESVPAIAEGLNLSRAEVHGVISFYHHFRSTPPARNVIRLCRAEACQARGSEALAVHAQAVVQGRDLDLETVYCLGLCASGPAMQIDETQLYARLSPEKFDALIAGLEGQS